MVTVFSDPMVGALTSITDKSNSDFMYNGKRGQHIPINGACKFNFMGKKYCNDIPPLITYRRLCM